MRRSLLPRLLGRSLAVAAIAAVGTALLTTRDPGDDTPLLSTDAEIRDALFTHANEHRSWNGVEPLVRALADRTGRRIALTTPDGERIADSAPVAALPSTPAARIDASAPPGRDVTPRPTVVARSAGFQLGFYVWQLTDEERRHRETLAAEAADCLRRDGTTPTRVHHRPTAAARPSGDPCVPSELHAPSAAGRRLAAEVAACQDAQCVQSARQSYVAPPADLWLGVGDRFDPLAPDTRWHTLATMAAILLLAAAVTVPATRRLLRPVRAVTAAARRLASGDHAPRVSVRGDDEVTRLAVTFNTMAAAIEERTRHRTALLGDVAHELRTPLTNVRTHLEAAQDGVLPMDPALVRSLIEESILLDRLVTDLHDLSAAESGTLPVHLEDSDLADLAARTVSAHRARAEASEVDLRLTVPGPVPVRADPARLRQALGNLVANALRHAPGGIVEVTVTADPVSVTVTDTGPGIAPEHLPHVFDRHYRAHPTGTGLGLAITRHIVEAHHGTVEVTSTPTTFTVHLPHPTTLTSGNRDDGRSSNG
ncbi:sensor histidine kinase [Actinophytocola gossypii]|uniref:histidine kinase n=1 Tax=Actinophytocola gossypii TaxID=2812003 RepID=A0ABT2JIY5_9PSEU|nr:HAMP domain-containing sensor histidine kinase [Actinophytocola gossypii]MCT2587849.1 HAMP domain-containing histidine kinase [Actinophytocola gossypii]